MNLIIFGLPGAGKGTQAEAISKELGIPHISTGVILRDEIKKGSELGKKASKFVESGKLVPDDVIIEMVREIITDKKAERGFIVDGFPRNLKQAIVFNDVLGKFKIKLDKVLNIVVDKEEIIKRINGRRTCSVCSSVISAGDSHMHDGKCPKCEGKLIKRKDDEAGVVKHRLEVFEEETRPLIDFYAEKGLLVNIDGSGDKEVITERILNSL